jgi:hypothetical protein
MRELTADLFISLDGFASGVDQPPYFGYFGPDLESWVRDHLAPPQFIIMGRVTYQALAQFVPSATDEVSIRMNTLPRLVFSSTLKETLGWKKAPCEAYSRRRDQVAQTRVRRSTPINL